MERAHLIFTDAGCWIRCGTLVCLHSASALLQAAAAPRLLALRLCVAAAAPAPATIHVHPVDGPCLVVKSVNYALLLAFNALAGGHDFRRRMDCTQLLDIVEMCKMLLLGVFAVTTCLKKCGLFILELIYCVLNWQAKKYA